MKFPTFCACFAIAFSSGSTIAWEQNSAISLPGCFGASAPASQKPRSVGMELTDVPMALRERVRAILTHLTSSLDTDPVPEPVFRDFGGIGVNLCQGNPWLYMGPDILSEIKDSPRGLELVLAHEIGHFLQYRSSAEFRTEACSGTLTRIITVELIADLVAGYAMQTVYPETRADDLIMTVSVLADYQFALSDHHGRVNDRSNAFNLGQMIASRGMPLDVGKYMKNQGVFMDILSGPRAYGNSANDVERFYSESLVRLYQ